MAASRTDGKEANSFYCLCEFLPLDGGACSCRYGDPLNADKLQVAGLVAFHF